MPPIPLHAYRMGFSGDREASYSAGRCKHLARPAMRIVQASGYPLATNRSLEGQIVVDCSLDAAFFLLPFVLRDPNLTLIVGCLPAALDFFTLPANPNLTGRVGNLPSGLDTAPHILAAIIELARLVGAFLDGVGLAKIAIFFLRLTFNSKDFDPFALAEIISVEDRIIAIVKGVERLPATLMRLELGLPVWNVSGPFNRLRLLVVIWVEVHD